MKTNIITISRQFGSGGHTIGLKLADQLGIPFYDQELVEKIAQEAGFDIDVASNIIEEAPGRNPFVYNFVGRDAAGLSAADRLWAAEVKVIERLANEGPCIIVGRCADYLLRNRDDVLRVFICADQEFREARIVERFGETSVSPRKRLADKDGKRAAHYRYYTGQKWGIPTQHDICLNTAHIGIDRAVSIIASLYNNPE